MTDSKFIYIKNGTKGGVVRGKKRSNVTGLAETTQTTHKTIEGKSGKSTKPPFWAPGTRRPFLGDSQWDHLHPLFMW